MGREFALQIPQLYKNLDELWVVARRTDRLKSLQEQVKIPVRIFDGDMQRDYIFTCRKRTGPVKEFCTYRSRTHCRYQDSPFLQFCCQSL